MTDLAIETEGLVKDYGHVRALAGLDLAVRHGEVHGFLGPNGAGKTTAIRVLLDQLRPTAGSVRVLGVEPRAGGPDLRARIGYLPGELALAARADAGTYLAHLVRLRGGRGARRVPELAERFGLDLSRPMRTLSKGNRQKVGVVQAFMHDPELLLLDEPTSGLDPLLQQEFRELTREAVAGGATVFLSSHVLSEVEAVADRVAIVRAGVVVDVDDVTALRRSAGQRFEVHLDAPADPSVLAAVPGVEGLVATDGRLVGVLRGEPDALVKALAAHRVVRLVVRDRDMEDLFLDRYRVSLDDAGPADGDGDGDGVDRLGRRGSRGRRRRRRSDR